MIFKDQTNQNTPCLRFGLHMVRTWHINHRLQQMQGFHEKHVQYGLTFHLFKFFLISKAKRVRSKKKFLRLRFACCDQVMCIQHFCLLITCDCSRVVILLGPEVIFKSSCSIQLSMKFILLINVKMPTIISILAY